MPEFVQLLIKQRNLLRAQQFESLINFGIFLCRVKLMASIHKSEEGHEHELDQVLLELIRKLPSKIFRAFNNIQKLFFLLERIEAIANQRKDDKIKLQMTKIETIVKEAYVKYLDKIPALS